MEVDTGDHDFWNAPGSIDWCEKNYTVSPYIAEWWNSMSNLVFLFLFGYAWIMKQRVQGASLETRFIVMDVIMLVIGIGSFSFHAFLTLPSQFLDELPMMYAITNWIYIALCMEKDFDETKRRRWAISLFSFMFVWTLCSPIVHRRYNVVFELTFAAEVVVGLVLMGRHAMQSSLRQARVLYGAYLGTLLLGTGFWLTDLHFCKEVTHFFRNYPIWWTYFGSLHGYWHLVIALNSYLGQSLAFLIRSEHLHLDEHHVDVHYPHSTVLPVVVIKTKDKRH